MAVPIATRFGLGSVLGYLIAGNLFLVIGIALMMTLVGLSPALGTFIAEVVLANVPRLLTLIINIWKPWHVSVCISFMGLRHGLIY